MSGDSEIFRVQDAWSNSSEDARSRPYRYPNAVLLTGPDGQRRWYVPVPDGTGRRDASAMPRMDAQAIARRLSKPISVASLARLLGVSPQTILREIEEGRFPEGSIVRSRNRVLIDAVAARRYVESLVYEPGEAESGKQSMDALPRMNAIEIARRLSRPISAASLARLCGVCRATITREIQEGRFPEGSIIRVRRRVLIEARAACAYVESRVYYAAETDND